MPVVRKTADIEELVSFANRFLKLPYEEPERRWGVIKMIEHVFRKAHIRYKFRLLPSDELPEDELPGIIIDDEGKRFPDPTRREYSYGH